MVLADVVARYDDNNDDGEPGYVRYNMDADEVVMAGAAVVLMDAAAMVGGAVAEQTHKNPKLNQGK